MLQQGGPGAAPDFERRSLDGGSRAWRRGFPERTESPPSGDPQFFGRLTDSSASSRIGAARSVEFRPPARSESNVAGKSQAERRRGCGYRPPGRCAAGPRQKAGSVARVQIRRSVTFPGDTMARAAALTSPSLSRVCRSVADRDRDSLLNQRARLVSARVKGECRHIEIAETGPSTSRATSA